MSGADISEADEIWHPAMREAFERDRMNVDENGLPIQSDGDKNDQLNRLGYIIAVNALAPVSTASVVKPDVALWGVKSLLQINPGTFTRYHGGDPNDVSADQLIPVLCGFTALGFQKSMGRMFKTMMARFGFAQNVVDGLNGDYKTRKVPDFMFLRAMPLFTRYSWFTYPLAWIFDLYLFVLVIGDVIYLHTNKDPADVNNTFLTISVCALKKPTLWSIGAKELWLALCPQVYERLQRYHRAESGGNPELAEIALPLIKKL
jgi:hypothetical protein